MKSSLTKGDFLAFCFFLTIFNITFKEKNRYMSLYSEWWDGIWVEWDIWEAYYKDNPEKLTLLSNIPNVKALVLWILLSFSPTQTVGQDTMLDDGMIRTYEFILENGVDWNLHIPYAKYELYEAFESPDWLIHPDDQLYIDSIVVRMEDDEFMKNIFPWLEEIYKYTGLKLQWIDVIHLVELAIFLQEGRYREAENIINFYSNLEPYPGFKIAFQNLALVPEEA